MKKIRDDFPDIAYFVFGVLVLAAFTVGILAGQQTTEGAYRPALVAASERAAELDRANTRLIGERNKLVEELAKRPFIVDVREGRASHYGIESGIVTSTGESFDGSSWTAAHRTFAPGTLLIVKALETGRWAVVRVNDFGPARRLKDREIDLSQRVAEHLGILRQGLARVRLYQVRLSDGD